MIATFNQRSTHREKTFRESISFKLERLKKGKKIRLLDLFSGCGGLSLGFHQNDYQIVGAIELDKDAVTSHALNFHSNDDFFDGHSKPRDIKKTNPAKLFKEFGLEGEVGEQIDIIVGGPPCQAFTRVGRAKLRETRGDSNAFLNDSRSQLYKRYLEYVRILKPVAILMENVPDVLNYGGVNICDLVCNDLAKQGYKCRYTLLNTVYYGVPQMRERMFLIAVHKTVQNEISFPAPTHYINLPAGYHGSRNVALKHINVRSNPYYIPPPLPNKSLTKAVTVKQALGDLPILADHLSNNRKRRTPDLKKAMTYSRKKGCNDYQRLMRNGSRADDTVTGNAIRNLPRDYQLFSKMNPGDQYPQALRLAKHIFGMRLKKEEKLLGKPIHKSSSRYKALLKEIVPPYDESKFPNKWRKMEPDKPSRTLMAHLGKDSYSHIHYDNSQARTISVREAARLQSFPDVFQFYGSMNAAFRQIGNAVPPLMAERIAAVIKQLLVS